MRPMTADDVDALEALFAAVEVADRPLLWSDASSETARRGFCKLSHC